MSALTAVDLSSEMAEGFALPPAGVPIDVLSGLTLPENGVGFHPRHAADRYDDAITDVISSVHLACGLHSGDAVVLQRCLPPLIARGVQLGAHPSYPDVFNFGQDRVALSHDELVAILLYQFGALAGVLSKFGQSVRHVKCHGALSFDVAYERWACEAMAEAIKTFDPTMVLVLMAGSPGVAVARDLGVAVIEEGFLDRQYTAEGRLVPRKHPKALHDSAEDVVGQLLGFVRDGIVRAVDGTDVPMRPRTFCLHSDTPSAVSFAEAVVAALDRAKIAVRPIDAVLETNA